MQNKPRRARAPDRHADVTDWRAFRRGIAAVPHPEASRSRLPAASPAELGQQLTLKARKAEATAGQPDKASAARA